MSDYDWTQIRRKNRSGSVSTGPPNFVTKPPKSGNKATCGFETYPEYIPDPIERAK